MSDIAASERRLSAALDRIDSILENWAEATSEAGTTETTGDASTAALAERLEAAQAEAARLSAANEALAAANRALINAAPDATTAALEAEIAALRAARAAELAQMGELVTQLERLLASDDAVPIAPFAADLPHDPADSAEIMRFDRAAPNGTAPDTEEGNA